MEAAPHINVKHWPGPLIEDELAQLASSISEAVATAFKCDQSVVFIALEPVARDEWNDRVYPPEIVGTGVRVLSGTPEHPRHRFGVI